MAKEETGTQILSKEPTQKEIWKKKCLAAGFPCEIIGSVLMFDTVDDNEIRKIEEFLGIRYKAGGKNQDAGTLPPFSFGFSKLDLGSRPEDLAV